MRLLAALLLFFSTWAAVPEPIGIEYETWPGVFGGECTTATDKKEGTCYLQIRKPKGRRK